MNIIKQLEQAESALLDVYKDVMNRLNNDAAIKQEGQGGYSAKESYYLYDILTYVKHARGEISEAIRDYRQFKAEGEEG